MDRFLRRDEAERLIAACLSLWRAPTHVFSYGPEADQAGQHPRPCYAACADFSNRPRLIDDGSFLTPRVLTSSQTAFRAIEHDKLASSTHSGRLSSAAVILRELSAPFATVPG